MCPAALKKTGDASAAAHACQCEVIPDSSLFARSYASARDINDLCIADNLAEVIDSGYFNRKPVNGSLIQTDRSWRFRSIGKRAFLVQKRSIKQKFNWIGLEKMAPERHGGKVQNGRQMNQKHTLR